MEDESKDGDIVGGPWRDVQEPKAAPAKLITYFHPYSGLAILAVDWVCFGIEAPLGALMPVVSVFAFLLTYWAVTRIQLHYGDNPRRIWFKALIGALAAGVPFPVTGTIVGLAILALSGLPTGLKRKP